MVYLSKPYLPINLVCRKLLLKEMVTKLCQATVDSNSYETALTVTGAGGSGKTCLVLASCQQPEIKSKFTGVLFVELGPQPLHANMHLSQIYDRLVSPYLKFDISRVQEQFNQLTKVYLKNLLVIIDDVWHVEDAEPIVRAFSNCKVVLTSRMNDTGIPTKQIVRVGEMEHDEATSLLTNGVFDISKLSNDDEALLMKLSCDVCLCPLLLSLLKALLLYHNQKFGSSPTKVIQKLLSKFHSNSSAVFEINSDEERLKGALEVCINELSYIHDPRRLKELVLYAGIGNSIPTAGLNLVWHTDQSMAQGILNRLTDYGLMQHKDVMLPPYNNSENHVMIPTMISEHIMDCIKSDEVVRYSPITTLGTCESLVDSLINSTSYYLLWGKVDATYYLKCRLKSIEYCNLLFHLHHIYVCAMYDPHLVITTLQDVQETVRREENVLKHYPTMQEQIAALIVECSKAQKNAHKMSRAIKQTVQNLFTLKKFLEVINVIKAFINDYPVGLIVHNAVTLLRTAIPHCEGEQVKLITKDIQTLLVFTPDYHQITLITLPHITLLVKEIQQINEALLAGPSGAEKVCNYYTSGDCKKDRDLVLTSYHFKRTEIKIVSN